MQLTYRTQVNKHVLNFFFLLSISFTALGQNTDKQQVIQWITRNAIAIQTTEPSDHFTNLHVLKEKLKGVKYIGLGETTHGTHEFFTVKHSLIKFLVRELGFTTFAIEASAIGCHKINDYIMSGKGSLGSALLKQGFWYWNTVEVYDLLEWLYQYNKKKPDEKKVRFMGFDMQYNLKNETYDILDAYLSKVDSNLFRKKRSLFDLLKNYELTRKIDFNRDSCYQAFLEIVGALVNSEAYYKRTFGTQSYLEALEAATLISQFLHVRLMNPDDPRRAERNWRDQYMANNLFKYIEQHPTSRIMVWAHNAHVAADPALVVNGGPKPLGSYLRNAFKDAYYAIGFSFNKGGFRANKIDDGKVLGVQPITVPEAREGSLDHLLSRAVSRFFLDFRQPMPGYMHSFLSSPIAARDNGDTYSDKFDFFPIGITRKKYDAIIFIDTTTPSISK